MPSPGPCTEPTFGGSHSMRENYEQGVGRTTSNMDLPTGSGYPGSGMQGSLEVPPCHSDSADKALPSPQRTKDERSPAKSCTPYCSSYTASSCIRCLDLAAGSGEATQAVEMWWASRKVEEAKQLVLLPPPHSGHSTKPTAAAAAAASERRSAATNEQAAALLSAGSADENVQGRGDPTPAQAHLASRSPTNNPPAAAIKSQLQLCIDAADPFTGAAYLAWTGKQAQAYSFEDVGSGLLLDEGRSYHLCICSYAMHCCNDSFLYNTLQQLSLVCEALVIISPHKLPRVEERTGWVCIEHLVIERVHARLFLSQNLQCSSDLEVVHGVP